MTLTIVILLIVLRTIIYFTTYDNGACLKNLNILNTN